MNPISGPSSQLAKNLQTFWDASMTQIVWNGAHNSSPHITLVAGLAVPDEKVEKFVDIVKGIWHQFQPDLKNLSEINLERYESPNFLGFFVGKTEEIILRSFVQALADQVKESLSLNIDAKTDDSNSSFHLTLAYQVNILNFPPSFCLHSKLTAVLTGLATLLNLLLL